MPEVVIGIDPGPEESAYVLWDGQRIVEHGDSTNHDLVSALKEPRSFIVPPNVCAIEQVRGFGVLGSDNLFDTCVWTGRFLQAYGEDRTVLIPRKTAAQHVCGVGGISKDKFVREALIAKFGGKTAVGTSKQNGPLYGISGHKWAALAIAITYWEQIK